MSTQIDRQKIAAAYLAAESTWVISARKLGYRHGASYQPMQAERYRWNSAEYWAYLSAYREGEESVEEFGLLEIEPEPDQKKWN